MDFNFGDSESANSNVSFTAGSGSVGRGKPQRSHVRRVPGQYTDGETRPGAGVKSWNPKNPSWPSPVEAGEGSQLKTLTPQRPQTKILESWASEKLPASDARISHIMEKLDAVSDLANSAASGSKKRKHDPVTSPGNPSVELPEMKQVARYFTELITAVRASKCTIGVYESLATFIPQLFHAFAAYDKEMDVIVVDASSQRAEAAAIHAKMALEMTELKDTLCGFVQQSNNTASEVTAIKDELKLLRSELSSGKSVNSSPPIVNADTFKPLVTHLDTQLGTMRAEIANLRATRPPVPDSEFPPPPPPLAMEVVEAANKAFPPSSKKKKKPTYSSVAGTQPLLPPARSRSRSRNATRKPKPEQHVTLVYANKESKEEINSSEAVFNLIKTRANPSDLGIQIKRVHKVKDNGYLIETRSKVDKTKLCAHMSSQLEDKLDLKEPAKKPPFVKIHGVPSDIADEDVPRAIYRQNPQIKEKFPEEQDFITRYKHRFNLGKKGASSRIIVAEITPDLIKVLLPYKTNSLSVGWYKCRVENHFNVLQCFKCCGFGHPASECKAETNICSHCSGPHKFSACTKDPHNRRCPNCYKAGRNKVGHNAYDITNCPILRSQTDKVIQQTDLGAGNE